MPRQPKPKKLRRAVIKEELVVITGDWLAALVLNQFLYWTERTQTWDEFVEEEKAIAQQLATEKRNGWFWKSSRQLADELMMPKSHQTLLRRIHILIGNGWVDSRQNPNRGMDHTSHYRVNLFKLENDLYHAGYHLEGYPLVHSFMQDDATPDTMSQADTSLSHSETTARQHGSAMSHCETNSTSIKTTKKTSAKNAPPPCGSAAYPALSKLKRDGAKTIYPEAYEKLWSAGHHPNANKAKGYEKWQIAVCDHHIDSDLIDARYRKYLAAAQNPQYIQHVATWIHQRGYEQEFNPANKISNESQSNIVDRATDRLADALRGAGLSSEVIDVDEHSSQANALKQSK